MRIKPPSKLHLERAKNRKISKYYWNIPQAPKKTGRLAQLSKHNRRSPSEFILMAERIDNE